jgi:POT family proton-dependent oligopeptide transporter
LTSTPAAQDRSFFGHPRGLMTLFFTEMWERFSYYGMRAILLLFMYTAVTQGGLGLSESDAAAIYGVYTSLVYLLPLAGGWLADNFLGQRRAVLFGGVIIMLGHICLTQHGLVPFVTGLACVVIGTGLLKPNIAGIVGQLYPAEDQRRDSGFSIFYMGINLGAFAAPLVCSFLAQSESFRTILQGWGIEPNDCWHWGFGAAAVGMFLGLVQYLVTGRHLGEAGRAPLGARTSEAKLRAVRSLRIAIFAVLLLAGALGALGYARSQDVDAKSINLVYGCLLFASVLAFFGWLLLSPAWSMAERRKLWVLAILFLGSCIFWGVFEQAGSTLTLFADKNTQNSLGGLSWGSGAWQSVQPAMIVLFAPAFAWLWARLGNFDPSSTKRFALGIFLAGAGFALLIGGARGAADGQLVSPAWLFGVYFLHTLGELCLSPVGLSAMTKLAPDRVVGMMLGVFYASISVGNFLGSKVAGVYSQFPLPTLFMAVTASALAMAILIALSIRPAQRLLAPKA